MKAIASALLVALSCSIAQAQVVPPLRVQNAGSNLPIRFKLNCTGALSCSDDGANNRTQLGVPYPLSNGTSTVTFLYSGTMTGTSTAFKSDTTNASTAGDINWNWSDGGISKLQLKISSIVAGSIVMQATSTTYVAFLDSALNGLKISGGSQVILRGGGSTDIFICDGAGCFPNTTALTMGRTNNEFASVKSFQYLGISNSPTYASTGFTATCGAGGEVQYVATVNANTTGIALTSGSVGQQCTLVFQKDATVNAYTLAFTGTNVRGTTLTMSTTASSLTSVTFRWVTALATPAWVMGAPQNNN